MTVMIVTLHLTCMHLYFHFFSLIVVTLYLTLVHMYTIVTWYCIIMISYFTIMTIYCDCGFTFHNCAFILTIMTSICVTIDLKMNISQNSDFTCQLVIETMSHNTVTLFLTVVSTVLYKSCSCDLISQNCDFIVILWLYISQFWPYFLFIYSVYSSYGCFYNILWECSLESLGNWQWRWTNCHVLKRNS